MEFIKTEVELIAKTEEQAAEASMKELHELQLALAGGGFGETAL